jgi:hypothetical protein
MYFAGMDPSFVYDRNTFVEFLRHMSNSLADPLSAAEWENTDLATFLEAMEAWTSDWKKPLPDNPWQLAATVLAAAKIYE